MNVFLIIENTDGQRVMINTEDLICVIDHDDYCEVHVATLEDPIMSRTTMNTIVKTLNGTGLVRASLN